MNHTEKFNQLMALNKPIKKEKIVLTKIEARKNMNPLQESISKCSIAGNVVSLPPIHDGVLSNYKEVRDAFLKSGAKYKSNTFIFPNDAQPYIDRLMGGEKINLKKEFQFFSTPSDLAEEIVELAEILPAHKVCEPSAGEGAIVKAIVNKCPSLWIDVCELMEINQDILEKNPNTHFICPDFLQIPSTYYGYYDRIVANPPFNKNQDIDHVRQMYKCLKNKGRIVSVVSKHWQHSKNKKETAFRDWLDEIDARIIPVKKGRFKESGTMIETIILVINKP